MRPNKTYWAMIVLLSAILISCPISLRSGESKLSLSVAIPAQETASTARRSIPSGIQSIYVQLVSGTTVEFSTQQTATASSTVSISAAVPIGTFAVHVFALSGSCVIGIATQEDVTIESGKTTSLSLTMSALSFSGATSLSSLGYANPNARAISKSVAGIPEAFSSYMTSGTARLYYKRNALPETWSDGAAASTATAQYSANQLQANGQLPAGTASANDTLYYWFVVQWPGCSAVLTSALPSNASALVFDGGTVAGNITGTGYGANSGTAPEANATIDLRQGVTTIQSDTTNASGNYVFGDVTAGSYNLLATVTDTVRWSTYMYNGQASLNGGAWSATGVTVSIPTITYTGLTVSSGSSVALNFKFDGY